MRLSAAVYRYCAPAFRVFLVRLPPRQTTELRRRLRGCPAKIFDLQDHLICSSFQTNDGIKTPRMEKDIREPFLRDAKKMSRRFQRQAPSGPVSNSTWIRF